MLFSRAKHEGDPGSVHRVAIVRDVVEVMAIIAAGIWAFYTFAYENRIKPSMANPDVDITASLQRLSERNGLIAVGLRLRAHNVGSVNAHLLGLAVNVYGQNVVAMAPNAQNTRSPLRYEYDGFYRMQARRPVFSYGIVTRLGDPSTGQDIELDPGNTIENYRTFYVPKGRFDLLTVGIDAPYTKYESRTIPAHLEVSPQGESRVVTQLSDKIVQFNFTPVTSLDVR